MNETEKKVEMALTDNELGKVAGGRSPDIVRGFRFYVTCDQGCGFRKELDQLQDAKAFLRDHMLCPQCRTGKLVLK